MTTEITATTEHGHPGGLDHAPLNHGYVAAQHEETPELRFPDSVRLYDRMRKTEGQLTAITRAVSLSLLGTRRKWATEGVPDQVAGFIATELILDEPGKGRGRVHRQGLPLRPHLAEAINALWLGFCPFNKVYEAGAPTPAQADLDLPSTVFHLRKLGIRHPRTIREIHVNADGGLVGVTQAPIGEDTHGTTTYGGIKGKGDQFIPARDLVVYSFEREGADWYGNSLLRSAYKEYLLKEQMLRTDAIAVDRHGVGLPVVYFNDKGTRAEALKIATGMRGGAHAGVALPADVYKIDLISPSGKLQDLSGRVKMFDEAMGRAALAMFLNLGHDNGARALGDTFVDFFSASLNAVNAWLDDTITEYVVRPLVEANFGVGTPYPVLESDPITSDGSLTAQSMATLVTAGILTPDAPLEADVRRRWSLPAREEKPDEEAAVEAAAGSPVAEVGIPSLIAAGVISPGEGRQMLRLVGPPPTLPTVTPSPSKTAVTAAAEADPLVEKVTALAESVARLRSTTHD